MKDKIAVHWFRRDLRLEDNAALSAATSSDLPILCLFIFDEFILEKLDPSDARVTFIHQLLEEIHQKLQILGSALLIRKGKPKEVWQELVKEYDIQKVYCNEDYEPYALERDQVLESFLSDNDISFNRLKDQVIFSGGEVLKDDGNPYTVYTPYKNRWWQHFKPSMMEEKKVDQSRFYTFQTSFLSLEDIGFKPSSIKVPTHSKPDSNYKRLRDFPSKNATSHLSTHLRFGSVSVREILRKIDLKKDLDFANELIWREFFMQILWHFPYVVDGAFKKPYNFIPWRNDEGEFKKWCEGKTGYPMVNAGMRELNSTGLMHNRVRMVTASFLCKHLLIDWRWGEAYFAEKLLDFELSSNNGNWQWAAGTGCDAAPYFRVFNPTTQMEKFDPNGTYVNKWIPELSSGQYPGPLIDHKFARQRAIDTYKQALEAHR